MRWHRGRGFAWSAASGTSFFSRRRSSFLGFAAILVGALVCNLILSGTTGTSYFHLGFADQPVAHTDGPLNFLGMMLTGFACVLLGGCPLRQLILSGEGSSDSAVTVFGLRGARPSATILVSRPPQRPDGNGKAAVIIGLVAALVIAGVNTFKRRMRNDNCGCKRLFLPGARHHAPQGDDEKKDAAYTVLVDNAASKENVTRYAEHGGYTGLGQRSKRRVHADHEKVI